MKIFANLHPSDILYQDPIGTYNPVLLSNLTDGLPQVDFPTYFSTFTPRTYPERVIVTYPAYVPSLDRILEDSSADVIEAYLVVRAALALSPHLGMSTEEWRAQRTLQEFMTGIKKGAVGDRSEYCISKVEETLGFAVGRYFVNETFGGDSRETGTKVITGKASSRAPLFPIYVFTKISSSHSNFPFHVSIGWMRNLPKLRLKRCAIASFILKPNVQTSKGRRNPYQSWVPDLA